ncbi:hypothetical protein ACFL35_03020 [Candidatus Riflebacteria bacterium]
MCSPPFMSDSAVEELFTLEHREQRPEHTKSILKHLKKVQNSNKPVWVVEYCEQKSLKDHAKTGALKENFLLHLTTRSYNRIGESIFR